MTNDGIFPQTTNVHILYTHDIYIYPLIPQQFANNVY